jgi:hypothetical protein
MALSVERATAPILRHVVARSRSRRTIYPDAASRAAVVRRLADACARHRLKCIVWSVTDRCVHFVVRGAASAITLATEELAGRRLLHGHCVTTTVNADLYLLELARHALDAPVRARLCRRPVDWPHSSARESFGLAPVPPWLDVLPLYDLLGPRDGRGPERLRRFMEGR